MSDPQSSAVDFTYPESRLIAGTFFDWSTHLRYAQLLRSAFLELRAGGTSETRRKRRRLSISLDKTLKSAFEYHR